MVQISAVNVLFNGKLLSIRKLRITDSAVIVVTVDYVWRC